MNLTLTQAFLLAFLLFGLFAVLNAYLNKWGPALAMFGMMLVAFISGVLQGVNVAWTAFVVIVAAAGAAQYFVSRRKLKANTVAIVNEGEISARMLEQMDKNVAERKARRFNSSFNAVPVPGQRDYLGRRKGGGGGWR